MAIWAKLDENSIVIDITVGDDALEDKGYSWLIENHGGTWVESNEITREAGIGWFYNAERNLFLIPEPVGHLGFDEENYDWISPEWVSPVFE